MDYKTLDCIMRGVCTDGDCIAGRICRARIYGFRERMVDYPNSVCD